MNKSFFRKVGFGLGVDESIPSEPLEWSISQIEKLPKLNWSGPIYSLKEMMEFHGKYNYQDRITYNDLTTNTSVRIYDNEIEPTEDSRAVITIDSTEAALFYDDRVEIGNLRFNDNILTNIDLIGDVVIRGSGTGVVQVDSVAQLTAQTDPTTDPDDGVLLYGKAEGDGGTGVFFRNAVGTQDELISRNKALLFSIIF